MSYYAVFKRYAPFETFGLGFHGDERSQPSLHGTCRTGGWVEFAFGTGVIAHDGWSGRSWHSSFPRSVRQGQTRTVMQRASASNMTVSFRCHSFGGLPLAPVPDELVPDIDTFIELTATRHADGRLAVNGALYGDKFPNAEAFLVEKATGRHALLCHFATREGRQTGPLTLPGAGRRQRLITFATDVVDV